MDTFADNIRENKSQSMADSIPSKNTNGKSAFSFVDNRPEAIAQRKLQEMFNHAPAVKQSRARPAVAGKYGANTAQRKEYNGEGSLQEKSGLIQKKENKTGLPDGLKSGMESLSGYAMDDVKVHYNSDQPAQLQAHAYAQGTDIHLAPGQEKHLPHEAWHVIQQKQGRVKPTFQMKRDVSVNDDVSLEREADVKGEAALQLKQNANIANTFLNHSGKQNTPVQLRRMDAGVTGLTHLVKMVNGSIMTGEEGREITHGTPVVIDNEIKVRSRRGPNHEIFGEEDKHAGQNYRWFKVLAIGAEDVSAENLYIRDQTFQTFTAEPVGERPAQISDAHRLRDPHHDPSLFAGHFTKKAKEMPEVYSSAVRQHIVKQWVQTKLRGVLAVYEDKRNKGKNNKGVFKVTTEEGRTYAVKVAVAPDSADYERENKKKSEVSDGLGSEIGLFAQIIDFQRNWYGLTMGLYPEAPGITLGQGLDDFKKELLSPKQIVDMYSKVASELARFNLQNEKVEKYNTKKKLSGTDGGLRAHTDANPDNILIHPETGQVTFIDIDDLSVNASPLDVERDVSSLMDRFGDRIGIDAGLEFKAGNPHMRQARNLMDVVLEIIEKIRDIYAAKIQNVPFKELIIDLCNTHFQKIKTAFDKNKG